MMTMESLVVIDSSVAIAILLGEAGAERYAAAISADTRRFMSAFSVLETSMVIEARKGEAGGRELDILLHRAGIRIIDLSAEQIDIARTAWRTFGKGRHPARLNIGDCCSYALARALGEPLLFQGDDFPKTDIDSVVL